MPRQLALAAALAATTILSAPAAGQSQGADQSPGAGKSQAPKMTRAEVMELFRAGGFAPAQGYAGVLDRCGDKARPRVRFVDLNGDKQAEALFNDTGACYGADRQWLAIASRVNGTWEPLLGVTGTAKGLQSSTNGWQDILWTSDNTQHRLHFDGARYVDESGAAPVATPAFVPAARSETPEANPSPVINGKLPSGVNAAVLSPAQFAAIMQAGGYTRTGTVWQGCGGSTTIERKDVELSDLNGDGTPEAIVNEEGTACFGNTGAGFQVLRQDHGTWRSMTGGTMTGYPAWKHSTGADGYPDFVLGGPGFCFPVMHWNGHAYSRHGFEYQGKSCKPGG
ncbi:hypothetical protein RXV95_07200 [Novosphingobium sp. ZN18A2]|uniref:hypothetical protein n=1 Tax=Novosphingobium sp. ZN18A2 TaxID=3079861 RepID=UPI0030CBFFE3